MSIEELKVKYLRRLMAKDAIVWASRVDRHPSPEALDIMREWKTEIKQKQG